MHRRWYGAPQINTRLPPAQFHALRAEARCRGLPTSSVIKELVLAWYQRGIGTAPDAQCDAAQSRISGPLPTPSRQAPTLTPRSLADTLAAGMQHVRGRADAPSSAPRGNRPSAPLMVTPSRLSRRPSLPEAFNHGGPGLRSGIFRD